MTQPYIGEIRAFPWDWAVRGWALCQGQTMAVAQNQALFALIGVTYGGNGTTTFNLPDLRGRVAVGIGQLAGGSLYTWGEATGTETVTLTIAQMPAHNHIWQASTSQGSQAGPAGAYLATVERPNIGQVASYAAPGGATPVALAPTSVINTGGNQPHPNIQPFTCINYSMALQGLFPSRN